MVGDEVAEGLNSIALSEDVERPLLGVELEGLLSLNAFLIEDDLLVGLLALILTLFWHLISQEPNFDFLPVALVPGQVPHRSLA